MLFFCRPGLIELLPDKIPEAGDQTVKEDEHLFFAFRDVRQFDCAQLQGRDLIKSLPLLAVKASMRRLPSKSTISAS